MKNPRPTEAERIEAALMKRIEESYDEGLLYEDIAGFFERKKEAREGLPMLGEAKSLLELLEKEPHFECVSGGQPVGGTRDALETASSAPSTSRGLTLSQDTADPEKPALKRRLGGYDGGTEIGLDGTWTESRFKDLISQLKAAKTAAQEGDMENSYVTLHGRTLAVSPKAASGGVTYQFILESDGVTFLIHGNPTAGIQPVRIRYGAAALIGRDLFIVHGNQMEFLRKLGFTPTGEKISRVDLQIMLEIPVTELTVRAVSAWLVCKAKNEAQVFTGRRGPTSFKIGSDISVRIYAKDRELTEKLMQSDPVKYALTVACCLGDDWLSEDRPLTRVEFQLRRPALKAFGIDSMEDLLESEAGLVRFLTHRWFRLLDEPRKETHTGRQATALCWQEVQKAFEKWFPGADGHNRTVKYEIKRRLKIDPEALIKQAVGCFASAASFAVGMVRDGKAVLSYAIETLTEASEKLAEKARERAYDVLVKTGVNVSDEQADWQRFCADIEIQGRKFMEGLFGPPLIDPEDF